MKIIKGPDTVPSLCLLAWILRSNFILGISVQLYKTQTLGRTLNPYKHMHIYLPFEHTQNTDLTDLERHVVVNDTV